MTKLLGSWGVAALLALSACSAQPRKATPADPDVGNSFGVIKKPDAVRFLVENGSSGLSLEQRADDSYLLLKKDALEREFMLSASLIPQRFAPTSSGLQSRIVQFVKRGSRIFLLESNEGNVVTGSLPAELVLAEIPVLERSEAGYLLDFNRGMASLFVAPNWWASDFDGSEYPAEYMESAVDLDLSYISSARMLDASNIEIRQIARTSGPAKVSLEARYFLSPYRPDPNFKAVESDGEFKRVGYFETPPVVEPVSGRGIVYRTTFDPSKPIKFSVSANTPPEYRQAVIDGILYWNKAFGAEVVQADIAPEGVTAPDPRYNVIQWVEWERAGFAYADALMDPRTGQIHHAQVYMTSAFAWGSRFQALQLLRAVEEDKGDEAPSRDTRVKAVAALKGFLKMGMAAEDRTSRIVQVARLAVASGMDDASLLRLAKDYVTEVIAHEVGHTLGLRHNFAGSLGMNVTAADLDSRFASYLKGSDDAFAGVKASSSVMEYNDLAEGIAIGLNMRKGAEALDYDRLAIRHAYQGEAFDPLSSPLFCTDGKAMGQYLDCERFDRGGKTLEGSSESISDAYEKMPTAYVERYLTNLSVNKRSAAQTNVNFDSLAGAILYETVRQLQWLSPEMGSVKVEARYEHSSPFVASQQLRDRYALINETVSNAGGVDKAFYSALSPVAKTDWVDTQVDAVQAYLAKDSVRQFQTIDGETLTLSDADVALITERARPGFAKLQQDLVRQLLGLYSTAAWSFEVDTQGGYISGGLVEGAEAAVASLTRSIILGTTVGDGPSFKVREQTYLAPNFAFPEDVRLLGVTLLSTPAVAVDDWNLEARSTALSDLGDLYRQSFDAQNLEQIDQISADSGSRALKMWWNTQRGITASFGL